MLSLFGIKNKFSEAGTVMETIKSVKIRKSGIELLRIISMLQVIFLHVCVYGGYAKIARHDASRFNRVLFELLYLASRCPVYVYILIFGYFSVTSNKTLENIKGKIVKIYLPMLFYSIAIPFLGQAFGLWELGGTEKVRAFFPLTSKIWYFMTLYVLVLILSPFLNKALTALTKKEYTQLVVILFLMFSVWTVFAGLKQTGDVIRLDRVFETFSGKSLYGFIYMYILGGYIRFHIPCRDKAKFRYLALFVLMVVINFLLSHYVQSYNKLAAANDNPFVVLQGICLLLFFRDIKFKSRAVNYIASVNLGVYMIHEHFLIRNKIWNDWFYMLHKRSFYSTWKYPFKIVLICLTVFTVCGIIEKLRVYLFKGIELLIKKCRRKEVKI